jgi:hypothetical protein
VLLGGLRLHFGTRPALPLPLRQCTLSLCPIRTDEQAAGVTALVVALLSLTLGVYTAFKLQVFQFPTDGASSRRRGDRSMLEDILLNDG